METKPLLYGLIGFFIGGLLVSTAATTFKQPNTDSADMSMRQMSESLKDKRSDDFDRAFIESMIEHHDGAIQMAQLSASNAKHEEVKRLSDGIISAQENEIQQMKQWQKKWKYTGSENHTSSNH